MSAQQPARSRRVHRRVASASETGEGTDNIHHSRTMPASAGTIVPVFAEGLCSGNAAIVSAKGRHDEIGLNGSWRTIDADGACKSGWR